MRIRFLHCVMVQWRLVVVIIVEEEKDLVKLRHIDFFFIDRSTVEEFSHLGFAAGCIPVDDISNEPTNESGSSNDKTSLIEGQLREKTNTIDGFDGTP